MIVTLRHIGKSWWWEQNLCNIICSDGRMVDPMDHLRRNEGMTYEVHETKEGIEARYFHCSSGQGKKESYRKLLIPRSEYTSVRHTGSEPGAPSQDVNAFVRKETGW